MSYPKIEYSLEVARWNFVTIRIHQADRLSAASQMLDEVEEAVMEEREEQAASVPREMEGEVSSSSSSSSNSSYHNRRGKRGPEDDDEELEENDDEDEDEDDSQVEDRAAVRGDLEQEERWLRIRQQLLLRRSGANRRALARVERRLWEISRSGFVGRRFPLKMDRDRQRSHHHHHRRNRHLSTDPSSRLSDELTDLREFNTCPEGYDYVDAERARELLRPETARQETRFVIHRRVGKGGERSDDEEEDSGRSEKKSRKKKKKKHVIGAAGYLEASLFGSDVSSSSSSPSSTNSDDCEGGGGGEDGIIRSDALKEFM
ncbi:hypothetical protein TSMEX_008981 [Taenia solium]|eukprot:TsM_001097000 transcript=TsM_001097000 gene=TsM_001097000